ncbi:glycosyltransferase family 2 protein [Candidatus Parcubacteria bacterium]|mgnify:CR=1 FL=1|jgi:glycosyltransferase involved in cell wall biosynthesis|nr:glycosyltransferase family 2 protein [Candidatus Parcubacteria bacterium]
MSTSLISIIIPVYNRIEEFRDALYSVLSQSYKDIEIIVIDDGSSEDIKKEIIDKGVTYVRQENRGAPAARNRGLELAKGDYVIFWDADVVADPQMLKKLKKQLDKSPDASFAYCNYNFGLKKMSAQSFDTEKLKQNNYIHTTSLIHKKDMVRWDESLKRFQDWDLWLSMVDREKKGVWVDEYLFLVGSGGTMSGWLPKIAYKKPWKFLPGVRSKVKKYEEAKNLVKRKHNI